jgi:hypothetical protein
MKMKIIATLSVLSAALILFAIPCFAAASYTVDLQMKPMSVHSDDFYVSEILDGRTNKSSIGFVQAGISNKQVPAYLGRDLADVIQSLVNLSFPADDTKIPVMVVIDRLRVSEKEEPSGEYARAEVKMGFFKVEADKVGKVFETEAFSDIQSHWDVTKYHEANIRNAVEKCFASFIHSNWKTAEVTWENQSDFESALLNESKTQLVKIGIIEASRGIQFVYQGNRLTMSELDEQLSNVPETFAEIGKAKSYMSPSIFGG